MWPGPINRDTMNTDFQSLTPLQRVVAMGNRHVCAVTSVNANLELQHIFACTPQVDANNDITQFVGSIKDRRDSLTTIGVLNRNILGYH